MRFKNSGVHGTHCTLCHVRISPYKSVQVRIPLPAVSALRKVPCQPTDHTTLAPSERHGKSLNLLWADGHVSNMSTNEYIQGKPSTVSAANGTGYWLYAFKK